MPADALSPFSSPYNTMHVAPDACWAAVGGQG
jgi:hypothetical protein